MIKHPKEKGRQLERLVAQMINEAGLGKAIRTPLSGGGGIPGDIMTTLPIFIECKNQSNWRPIEWWNQLLRERPIGGKTPVLIMKKSYAGIFAMLRFEDLLGILDFAQKGGWR